MVKLLNSGAISQGAPLSSKHSGTLVRDVPLLLDGVSSRFKGGRLYVHGTDIVAWLDSWIQHVAIGGQLAAIEFKKPLTHRGILVLLQDDSLWDLETIAATGHFYIAGASFPFFVFPSPMRITQEDAFDEDALMAQVHMEDEATVSLIATDTATLMEHVSSAMKVLCAATLPKYGSAWWFVRCKLLAALPRGFTKIQLKRVRVLAGSMVVAELTVDDTPLGRVSYVARKP
jgi:hypothetical protein